MSGCGLISRNSSIVAYLVKIVKLPGRGNMLQMQKKFSFLFLLNNLCTLIPLMYLL